MTPNEIIEKLAEKEIKFWFRQWCGDEYSDIEEYFKSIWIEGYQKALSLQKKKIGEVIGITMPKTLLISFKLWKTSLKNLMILKLPLL